MLISAFTTGILGRWDVLDYFRKDHSPATPTCRARVLIRSVILEDTATVFSRLWLSRLSTLRSSRGAKISSITGTIGKPTRRGKEFGRIANRGSPLRAFLKGLILLCATGVKIREGKRTPAMRHARRAGALLRDLTTAPHDHFSSALGISPGLLADLAEATAEAMPESPMTNQGQPETSLRLRSGRRVEYLRMAHRDFRRSTAATLSLRS
jgi:hypothetical protein